MANNWPDGGELPLSRGEKLAMNVVAVVLVAALLGGVIFLCLSFIGPRPTKALSIGAAVIGLAAAIAWVHPWETEPPKPSQRQRQRGRDPTDTPPN